jgi:hypothetical protein
MWINLIVNPPFLFIKAHTIASLGSKLLDTLQYDGTSHVLRGMAASHMLKAGALTKSLCSSLGDKLRPVGRETVWLLVVAVRYSRSKVGMQH